MAARKKKASKKKAVARRASTKVGAQGSYLDVLAALAEEQADRKTAIGGGGNTIRLSKGKFKFQGEDIGDELTVVVIDFVKRRNYYDTPFDEDKPSPPACFAISRDGKGMEPHETSPEKQAELCAECWANEFETDNRGKGKACRESYLLACVSPDELEAEDPTIAYLSVPPTSLAAWDGYMVKRNKVMHLPSLAFVTGVTFDEEVDYQKLIFDEAERTPESAIPRLLELRETLLETLMEPPDVSNYGAEEKKAKKKTKKTAKKKTKKKAKKKSSRSRF